MFISLEITCRGLEQSQDGLVVHTLLRTFTNVVTVLHIATIYNIARWGYLEGVSFTRRQYLVRSRHYPIRTRHSPHRHPV